MKFIYGLIILNKIFISLGVNDLLTQMSTNC